jgi:hypothetical protein
MLFPPLVQVDLQMEKFMGCSEKQRSRHTIALFFEHSCTKCTNVLV